VAKVVVDTSAALAAMMNERGGDIVRDGTLELVLSSVNLAELVGVLGRKGLALADAYENIEEFGFDVADFDRKLAEQTGALISQTRGRGLSLGDCACLALAARENLPVLTADHGWEGITLGVQVQFIR
jgi:PIN domain nuclease of toxin-antitoxin system